MRHSSIVKIKNNHDFFIVTSIGYEATWYKNVKMLIIYDFTIHKRVCKCICNNKSTVFKKINEVIPYN